MCNRYIWRLILSLNGDPNYSLTVIVRGRLGVPVHLGGPGRLGDPGRCVDLGNFHALVAVLARVDPLGLHEIRLGLGCHYGTGLAGLVKSSARTAFELAVMKHSARVCSLM